MNFYYMLAVFENGDTTNIGIFESRASAIAYAQEKGHDRFECRRLYYDSGIVQIKFNPA